MIQTSELVTDRAGFQMLRVGSIRPEAGDSIVIGFDVPEGLGRRYSFSAGQHLTLRRHFDGEEVRRSYSICVAPDDERLEIAIRRVRDGQFSGWAIDNLRPGDEIDVLPPSGHFAVPASIAAAREVVFIAAGSGITPILSQMRTLLEREPCARVTLLYLNRTVESTMFVEELLALKNTCINRCAIWFQNSQEKADGALFCGRLTAPTLRQLLSDDILPRDADAWMLCGPQLMIDMVRSTLSSAGIDSSRVHTELFGVAATPASPPLTNVGDTQATVRFNGRNTTLTVPAGENVLDAARRLRADLPFACKTGVCSTCRAKLLRGRVEMGANYALDADEIERGFVLTCQSYPTTEHVEIDFDA